MIFTKLTLQGESFYFNPMKLKACLSHLFARTNNLQAKQPKLKNSKTLEPKPFGGNISGSSERH